MKKIFLYWSVATALVACSGNGLVDSLPDNRPDYKTSNTVNPLEIPPDLTQSSIDDGLTVAELSATDNASLATYQKERGAKKQDYLENALKDIQSSGDASWIEIAEKPDEVFKNAKSFWLNNGLNLTRVDKQIGIMETDWLENKANLPKTGLSALLAKTLKGLHDSGVRDKFRTRIDYDGKHSYVYLTHYGATEEEVTTQGKIVKNHHRTNKDTVNNYVWMASSRNPELEIEMLRRLNLYLHKRGKATATKTPTHNKPSVANLGFLTLSDNTPALALSTDFNRAWILLGIAIDRAGYELTNQRRKTGTYTFAKITEKTVGFILKDLEREVETYQIGLADQGSQQVAVVLNYNGSRPSAAKAKEILQKISQKVNF